MTIKFSTIQTILEDHSIDYKSFSNGTLLLTFCPFHNNSKSPSLLILVSKSKVKCQNPSCAIYAPLSIYLKKLNLTEYICSENEDFFSDEQLIDSLFVKNKERKRVYIPPDSSEIYENLYLPEFIKEYMQKRGFSLDFCRNHFIGYDSYKKCLTIPFFSNGKYLGINKRLLKNENFKYILPKNLPKNIVFSIMREELVDSKEAVYVTEGIFDCMSLVNLGLKAVCTFGSNFDTEQIESVYRMTENPIIFFDSDEAGRKAAERWLKLDKSPFLRLAMTNLKDPGDCKSLTDFKIYDRFDYVEQQGRRKLRS